MRVALFFDGPNFYRSMEVVRADLEVDYERLADWLVTRVGGPQAELIGAWYHTGLSDQPLLDRFLRGLELRPGYYVRRHRVVERSTTCPRCGESSQGRVEKGVDTAIAVDMVRMTARGILDRAVLLSGDEDMLPAVQAVQEMGRPVWLASWGGIGLSMPLRSAAYGHIDLLEGVDAWSTGRTRGGGGEPTHPEGAAPIDADALPRTARDLVLEQVRQATAYFEERNGHLSRAYFENRWDAVGQDLPQGLARTVEVDALLEAGAIELYEATVNGRRVTALRPRRGETDRS